MGKVIYDKIWKECEGISVVECIEEKKTKEKIRFYQFLTGEKKFINRLRYENASCFEDGTARVKNNGLWGLIDNNGNEVIPIIYKQVFRLSNKLFQVSNSNLWGIINSENKVIVPVIYDYVFPPMNEYVVVRQKNKYGIIDINGGIVVKIECDTHNEALKIFNTLCG